MRLNKYIALATGLSRRKADELIANHEITVNGESADVGYDVQTSDEVKRGREVLRANDKAILTVLLNKPVGYVCSRDGQGSKTIYDLLPQDLHQLKPVGRLDKESSGLLLLTNDGELAHQLTHPSFQKEKVYEVEIDKPLSGSDHKSIESGVELEDGKSILKLQGSGKTWTVTMSEGRNRQIRRTFEALGYSVTKLHRTKFGSYGLDKLREGLYTNI